VADDKDEGAGVPETMVAIRLHAPGGVAALALDRIETPRVGVGEALVRVHAAAITRGELEWPLDRLPAIPSYELSGTVAALGAEVSGLAVGDDVWALTGFDRDGAAGEYAAVPAAFLAPKPRTLGHVESAAIPLAGLTAWQGLFEHGRLSEGERVLIHGAAGGVGQFATQLARWRGAYVIGTASGAAVEDVRALGADEAFDRAVVHFEEAVVAVDLVFDTVGGETLARSDSVLREGGRIVSLVEEPPTALGERVEASHFVVEPNREQLIELARLVDAGSSAAGRLRLPARRCAQRVRARRAARQAREGGTRCSRRALRSRRFLLNHAAVSLVEPFVPLWRDELSPPTATAISHESRMTRQTLGANVVGARGARAGGDAAA
jgi:NADPH:quinone reductase-like Zn-dependent oxidoreductase